MGRSAVSGPIPSPIEDGNVQEEDGFTRWIEACAAGELLGIASAALWWVSVERFDPLPIGPTAEWLVFLAKAASGLIQGLILGYLQGWALRRQFPALSLRAWVTATTLIGVIVWSIGAWYSVFPSLDGGRLLPPVESLFQTAIAAGGFGLGLGLLFGAAQAVVLRRAAGQVHWWIAVNAVGWGAALPCIYVASAIGSTTPGSWEIALRGLVGGVVSGVALGTITGLSFAVMPVRRAA
ncbi:hypothetical protein [Sphingomonas sp. R1]|uniref:hypothetical protein n=1 Tax=Sphingomonas sp. R1 TaxID=399176 RepID=UPI002225B6B2|nr:hypothetical protein [Sphingomonas sp. R1]UYY78100.1 hypothetical protein OIM94_03595 [Sphingomonas sp. R1]